MPDLEFSNAPQTTDSPDTTLGRIAVYLAAGGGGGGGPAAAGSLTGTTLAANVVTSSLTTVGTLGLLAVTGGITTAGSAVLSVASTIDTLGTLPTDQSGSLSQSDTLLQALGRIEQNYQATAFTNGANFTGAVSVTGATLTIDRIVVNQTAQSYSASTTINFNATTTWITIDLTGDITFATSNLAAGREMSIKILADASTRAFTFPAWIWVGGVAPANIAANKTAILTLRSFSTTDASVVASYAVQS